MAAIHLSTVKFSEVPVGGWFVEPGDTTWHYKNTEDTAIYKRWGTTYEPHFRADETVQLRVDD